ncbi:DeoR/GlpR family DNA-binding transcription regulator [Arthrobacter mobilis]|uniref:DeoR/GlpR transcriptional regulator n=1 Tax=Arthrobacter mobilis TaxID=2724944 RepID=A0A7X6H9R5_9MICC|nr:DeoR/GlpR family DNA-binding transcription regulator [Arthrobacter mobilis]NKX53081.1 DeoR/GlpR transcriptional regulator [Arthrobacter mobilis]
MKAAGGSTQRLSRQLERQRIISEMVMAEGAVRIDELAERFGTSQMTVHRDLDELEARGLLRKSRGVATALSSSLVESSDVFRAGQQQEEKQEIAKAAVELIEPGQAIFLDDSTTVLELAKMLHSRAPLTVLTNVLTVINELKGVRGITLVALGGTYYNWCSSFMGGMTTSAIRNLRADLFVMSAAAVTDDACFHQNQETVDIKRAMFEASAKRILLVDHTKFGKRALHALAPLSGFDAVVVDSRTRKDDIARLEAQNIRVVVARGHGRSEVAAKKR